MSENLINKMTKTYKNINSYKNLSADELIEAARSTLLESKDAHSTFTAVKLLEKAISKGSSRAKLILAKMYKAGFRIQQNNDKAAALFKELIEEGDITAQRLYADMIYYGHIADKEKNECIELYKDCATKGDLTSKYQLANIYRNGDFLEKPDYETALNYYDECLNSQYNEREANGIIASCCREAIYCQLESFYIKEANSARDSAYYKRRPSTRNLGKKYFEHAERLKEYMSLDDRIAFESSIQVYRDILKDDSLDISKINYGEFRARYFNKHPKIFLTTKKTEPLIYKEGIRRYFVMRDDAAEELENELIAKQKHAEKQKSVVKKVVLNLNIANTAQEVQAFSTQIENSVTKSVENFKDNYNVDYSLCVTNLDKYLEEVMYQIFVEGLHKHRKQIIEAEKENILKSINSQLSSSLGLGNLIELISGDSSKIPVGKYEIILKKFINNIKTNNQAKRTAQQIEDISNYFYSEEPITAQEEFLMYDILHLYQVCKDLRQLKIKETFTFGELFNIAFVEDFGMDRGRGSSQNILKPEILDYVLKISTMQNVQEVYLKLNELILKLEHFRVMVRNVASHKSILTQRAMENGLNICITQETSIFNLLDDLFGDYLEKQTYIAETKKYLKSQNLEFKDSDIEMEVSNVFNSVE